MGLILLIVVIALLLFGLPRWNYSQNWGYAPTGVFGLIVVVVLLLLVFGHVRLV